MTIPVGLALAGVACLDLALLLALVGAATLDEQNAGTRIMASLGVLGVFFLFNAYAADGFIRHFGL